MVFLDKAFTITDASNISFDLPELVQQVIGQTVTACARLEHTFELLTWGLLSLQPDDGALITARMQMDGKSKLVKALINSHGDPKLPSHPHDIHWKGVAELVAARAKIAHAVWIWADGHPAVVSSKWESPTRSIAAERFKLDRLKTVARLSHRLEIRFKTYANELGMLPPEPGPLWQRVFLTHLPSPQ